MAKSEPVQAAPNGHSENSLSALLKWLLCAGITGLAAGVACLLFRLCVDWCDQTQSRFSWLLFLLPIGGVAIAALYRAGGMENDIGPSRVLLAIRKDSGISRRVAPLIFLATCATHLLGGSAGRVGAGIQLGGCLSYQLGRRMPLDEKARRIVTMCGMSAAFCVMFGTPLAAAVFALEVVSVGVMYYSALLPCLLSSLVAMGLCALCGISPAHWRVDSIPAVEPLMLLRVAFLAALCAGLSVLFCLALRYTGALLRRFFPNCLLRAAVGGVLFVALLLLSGSRLYTGAGAGLIALALNGDAPAGAFLWKLLLTVITLSCGFKGGEITPVCCIGAAFGCFVGPVLGLNPSFAAALGIIALFCGVVNCPMASIVMSAELFGADGILYYALAAGVSYMLSGYTSLYGAQQFVYSKTRPEYISRTSSGDSEP